MYTHRCALLHGPVITLSTSLVAPVLSPFMVTHPFQATGAPQPETGWAQPQPIAVPNT